MTRNQIEYQKLLETKRSNLVGEALTQSLNTANVSAKQAELAEVQRSNLAKESETAKHNRATEQHALAQLGLSFDTLAETTRSNKAREAETYRSNVARESENYRSNVARETETNRSNVVNENIQKTKNTVDALIRQESNRISRTNTGIQQQLANIQADDLARKQSETEALNDLRQAQKDNSVASTYKVIRDAAIAREQLSIQQEEQTRKWVETNMRTIDQLVGYGKDLITAIKDVARASGTAIGAKVLQWLAV